MGDSTAVKISSLSQLTEIGQIKELLIQYSIKIAIAIVIVVVGRLIVQVLKKLIEKTLSKSNLDPTVSKFIVNLSKTAMMVFVIVAALSQLGIETTSFVAIIGAAGLAIGLALQGSLSNFAAGVLLLIFKPFKVGDFISGGGTTGGVQEIGIFTTTLHTPDNKKIIVPNSKLTSDNITNFSANPERKIDLVFGCGYEDKLDLVQSTLEDILNNHPKVLKEPEPFVGVLELADSSVNFAVRPWVKLEDYWDVYFDIQRTVKDKFDEKGISIPYPQKDVHLYKKE